MRILDVALGLLFGVAYAVRRAFEDVGTAGKTRFFKVAGPALAWVLVSGSLLWWHEWQVRVRSTIAPRDLTLNQIWMARAALKQYFKDCGAFPSQEQGLAALCKDPGMGKWSGPYMPTEFLTDPWGNPLQYSVRDNQVDVWSFGPDGENGTEDDIRAPDDQQP